MPLSHSTTATRRPSVLVSYRRIHWVSRATGPLGVMPLHNVRHRTPERDWFMVFSFHIQKDRERWTNYNSIIGEPVKSLRCLSVLLTQPLPEYQPAPLWLLANLLIVGEV